MSDAQMSTRAAAASLTPLIQVSLVGVQGVQFLLGVEFLLQVQLQLDRIR